MRLLKKVAKTYSAITRLKRKSVVRIFLLFLTRYLLLIFLVTIILVITGSLISRKIVYFKQPDCSVKVCLDNTGIHSNFILPEATNHFDWHQYLSIENIGKYRVSDYKYLSFGWGDKDFYMSTPSLSNLNLSIALALKALFLPTPSVIYIKGYNFLPINVEIKCVNIGVIDYLKLTNFIINTFELNKNNEILRIGDGHTDNAGFYAAKGSYSILRNCNSWVAEGLRKANINTPLWSGLPAPIMWHLQSSC
jgi:uncharacterized protein (TIGR02117 family)